jgi:replicative DNA helicase
MVDACRAIPRHSLVPLHVRVIREKFAGSIEAEIAGRLAKTIRSNELRKLPIQIVDSGANLSRIAALIRLACRRDQIRLAVVDYLQLVQTDDRSNNRERQVAEVSRTLKRLAMECGIPVIAPCQLNRASEQENRKPRLSDLRESGSIEQDADLVGFIHRTDDGAEFILAKQRNGSPGVVRLAFQPERFRFENAAIYDGRL